MSSPKKNSSKPKDEDMEAEPLLHHEMSRDSAKELRQQHNHDDGHEHDESHSCGSSDGPKGELRTCRICFETEDSIEDADPDNPLISPCQCSGSSRYVHRKCLDQWRHSSHRQDAYYQCEVRGVQLPSAMITRCKAVMLLCSGAWQRLLMMWATAHICTDAKAYGAAVALARAAYWALRLASRSLFISLNLGLHGRVNISKLHTDMSPGCHRHQQVERCVILAWTDSFTAAQCHDHQVQGCDAALQWCMAAVADDVGDCALMH
jgi:hypothetical protein